MNKPKTPSLDSLSNFFESIQNTIPFSSRLENLSTSIKNQEEANTIQALESKFVIWDKRFLKLAQHISTWSKDRGRKVGCVIVGPDLEIRATGYNGFPRGINDNVDSYHERPEKYFLTCHAEANAFSNANRIGVSTRDCTLYVNLFPCVECTRTMIQSGISSLITLEPDFNDSKYGESFSKSVMLLKECDIDVEYLTLEDLKEE